PAAGAINDVHHVRLGVRAAGREVARLDLLHGHLSSQGFKRGPRRGPEWWSEVRFDDEGLAVAVTVLPGLRGDPLPVDADAEVLQPGVVQIVPVHLPPVPAVREDQVA